MCGRAEECGEASFFYCANIINDLSIRVYGCRDHNLIISPVKIQEERGSVFPPGSILMLNFPLAGGPVEALRVQPSAADAASLLHGLPWHRWLWRVPEGFGLYFPSEVRYRWVVAGNMSCSPLRRIVFSGISFFLNLFCQILLHKSGKLCYIIIKVTSQQVVGELDPRGLLQQVTFLFPIEKPEIIKFLKTASPYGKLREPGNRRLRLKDEEAEENVHRISGSDSKQFRKNM